MSGPASGEPSEPETWSETPAIVLGTGVTALGVIRELGRLGVPTYLASDEPGLIRRSRWYRALEGAPGPLAPRREVTDWIRSLSFDEAVLVPCTDDWVATLSSILPLPDSRYAASVPPADTVDLLVDKGRFAEHMRRERLPHPTTVRLDTIGDLDAIDDELLERSFLKPRDSQGFYRTFGAKALRVDGRAEAVNTARDILDRGHGVLVQEMVPGPTDHQLCVDGFVDRHGTLKALFVRRWLRKYPDDFGESSLAVSVAPDSVEEAVDLATRTVSSLDYRGVFSVELKRNAREGRLQVLEVNARPWWYVGFTCEAGVNVCEMLYRDALELPVSEATEYEVGRHVAYPYYDWHAVHELPPGERDGYLKLLLTWARAVQPIFSWSDPGPSVQALIDRVRTRFTAQTEEGN